MKVNYRNSELALTARENYYKNRGEILSGLRERYSSSPEYRAKRIASAQEYRKNNIDYVNQFDRLRAKIRYHQARGHFEKVAQLEIEKKLLQMSKPNRKGPMTHMS